MARWLAPPVVGLACWLAGARSAQAQQVFGTKGQLVISAEELFEFSTQTLKIDEPGYNDDYTITSTRFGFLFSGRRNDPTTVTGTKIGAHYFITKSLSIGGSIGYESRGRSISTPTGPNSYATTNRPGEDSFVLVPKVGYSLLFNEMLGFWFRGGIGYSHTSIATSTVEQPAFDHVSMSHWFLTLDAPFIVSPVPNLAFYAGPSLNVSFTGSADQVTVTGVTRNVGSSFYSVGLGFGLLGYFYVW